MAKCNRCGKKKLFLKVNQDGLCPDCVMAVKAELEEYQRKQRQMERERRARERREHAAQRLDSIPEFNIILSDEKRNRQRGYEAVKTSNITPKGIYDRFVVFDTETTGTAPSKDRIIELGAIRFCNGTPVEKFTTFVNPERPIPTAASDVNHITDDLVADAPTISQVLPSFEAFIGDDILIAHNLEFDLKFLFYSGSQLLDRKRKYIDTLEQAQRILKKPRRKYDKEFDLWDVDYDSDYDVEDYKLKTLCEFYNITHPGSHRATADALATGDVFLRMVDAKQG